MNRTRERAATIAAGACLVAVLVIVPSAQAAVTASTITSPKDVTYLVYNRDTPNTFSISGTTNATTGNVDVNCYAGDQTSSVAANVAVSGNGSFSVPAADLQQANIYRVCHLKAVPAGTTPDPLTQYVGPRLLVGVKETHTITGGPNNGRAFDFNIEAQQLNGSFDYASLGGCGINDGYMLDSTDSVSTLTFYCNDFFTSGGDISPDRSQLQIDGKNSYPAGAMKDINPNAAGFKPVVYSYSLDPKTGNFVIHDTEALLRCPDRTWPPTTVTCASVVSAGVIDHRTIMQDHKGRVAWVKDVFTSADGSAHTLDLQWQNAQRFYGADGSGNASNVEYKFPGEGSYSTHGLGDTVHLPNAPGTIFIRVQGAADGATNTGRGAIVYNRPATKATFDRAVDSENDFNLEQKASVPGKGSVVFRTAYIQEFFAADIASLSAMATKVVQGCTVPKVVGKPLNAAKNAITGAHCAVGKISYKASGAPSGRVIAQRPGSGMNVDYGARVGLVVSKG